MASYDLICKALAHLRRAPNERRLAELLAAGVPADDREALARWVRSTSTAAHEQAGGLYLAGTARLANGTDADLPAAGHWGCRVEPVTLRAGRDDDSGAWVVMGGEPHVGAHEAVWLAEDAAATAEEAEAIVRARLLARGDCFATRAEAERAAIAELARRAGTAS